MPVHVVDESGWEGQQVRYDFRRTGQRFIDQVLVHLMFGDVPSGEDLLGNILEPAQLNCRRRGHQALPFSDLSIQACFSRSTMMLCSRSAVDGSAASTSSWIARTVSTVA